MIGGHKGIQSEYNVNKQKIALIRFVVQEAKFLGTLIQPHYLPVAGQCTLYALLWDLAELWHSCHLYKSLAVRMYLKVPLRALLLLM